MTEQPCVLPLDAIDVQNGGGKAWGARRLAELAAAPRSPFRSPGGVVLPFGVCEACLVAAHRDDEVRALLGILDDASRASEWPRATDDLHALIEIVALPEPLLRDLRQRTEGMGRLAVRSSSNAEDREGAVGAGLFDSVIGVHASELPAALRQVWASLYGRRSLASCRTGHAPLGELGMAVLIQPVLSADLSFVLYTRSPFGSDDNQAYVELAAGLGETLAGASGDGSPYRMHLDRSRRSYHVSSYLSYPEAIRLGEHGSERRPVQRDDLRFEHDESWRRALAERLIDAAQIVEAALGGPQDVEGVVRGDELWLLQSRPAASGGQP